MNIPVPTIPEMPTHLKPGEVMIYLDLHLIENMAALDAVDLARSLGFTPELRCKTLTRSEQVTVGIYALLHHEQRQPNAELEETFFEDELGELRERIVPDTAVHLRYRLEPSLVTA
jgi:hypothetical protein